MTEKKPYSPPQIFQVDLNQEQAILAVCATNATTVSNQGPGRGGCKGGGAGSSNCRRSNASSPNSGPTAS